MWDFNFIMYVFSYDTRNIWVFCPTHWLSKTGFQTLYIHVYIYLRTYLYLYLVRCRTQLWFLYNVHNYVKCAFKFMHLIWSVCISAYIILHLMPVILFVGVTEGYICYSFVTVTDENMYWIQCHIEFVIFIHGVFKHLILFTDVDRVIHCNGILLIFLYYFPFYSKPNIQSSQLPVHPSAICLTTSLYIVVSFITPCISL